MRKEDKGVIIEQLTATINEYPNFYLTDIEAMDAETTSRLRKALENVEGDFTPLHDAMKGNTAVMFSMVANAPARLIKDFTKDTKGEGKPQLKGAYVQEGFYDAASLDVLVSIKSKKELIADVIALLESPAKNVISALQSSGQTIHGLLKTLEER